MCLICVGGADRRFLWKCDCCQLKNICLSVIFMKFDILLSSSEGLLFVPCVLVLIHTEF
jgi:hypothetical protein